jgi:hypothetical protein
LVVGRDDVLVVGVVVMGSGRIVSASGVEGFIVGGGVDFVNWGNLVDSPGLGEDKAQVFEIDGNSGGRLVV